MSTIIDVAERAGVSSATVSNVMTGKKWVSPELTERVRRAMEELDYTPNVIASGLRSSQTFIIGVVLPSFYHPYHASMLKGIQDVARSTRYTICSFPTSFDQNIEWKCLQQLKSIMPDGILLSSYLIPDSKEGEKCISMIEKFTDAGVPVISLERNLDIIQGVRSIYFNQEKAAKKVMEYLIGQGHTRIAHIGGTDGVDCSIRRKNEYLRSMAEHGLEVNPEWVEIGTYTSQTGYDAMKKFLQMEENITAVFCGNDEIAMGAIKAAKNKNMRIPEDIAIVGFDNINLSTLIEPSITTINVPSYEIGKIAMESLVDRLSNDEKEIRTIEVDTALIKRGSTEAGKQVQWEFL